MSAVAVAHGSAVEAQRVLARQGRSFHWASRLLPDAHAERAARLYAFCRRLDDAVDDSGPGEAGVVLARVRSDLRRGSSADPQLCDFLALCREVEIDRAVPEAFLDGLATDLATVRIADDAALVRYGYGVAGTVGLMMCDVLGVADPAARPFAIDLGVAMQLTNVARDVLEDAARGRLYLPASGLSSRVTPGALVAGDPLARREAREAVDRVLALARPFYRSADRGMAFLPRRARLGILTASRVYEAIGAGIARRGARYWQRRVRVRAPFKLLHTARALLAFALPRPSGPRALRHDPALHAPLRGLPGADRAAA